MKIRLTNFWKRSNQLLPTSPQKTPKIQQPMLLWATYVGVVVATILCISSLFFIQTHGLLATAALLSILTAIGGHALYPHKAGNNILTTGWQIAKRILPHREGTAQARILL